MYTYLGGGWKEKRMVRRVKTASKNSIEKCTFLGLFLAKNEFRDLAFLGQRGAVFSSFVGNFWRGVWGRTRVVVKMEKNTPKPRTIP
tara:strand:- start:21324 stop:21584 length:261 start_codon:yes stop_codon:yes gene_type:complete